MAGCINTAARLNFTVIRLMITAGMVDFVDRQIRQLRE